MTRAVGVDEWVFVLVDWSCLEAKTDDRRQESSQLVGTTRRTRDFGRLFIRRGCSLISTVARNGLWQGT